MPGESFIQVPVDGAGKKLRTWQKVVGANTVEEEFFHLVDGNGNEIAVINATPTTEYGLVVRNIPSGTQTVGGTVSLAAAIPAGTNNIGDVDVLTLPAIPAGTNNIGDVDVLTVPADPFGANADAVVAAGAAGSMQAKLRRATQGLEDLKTLIVLAAGNNNIGDVDIASLPGAATATAPAQTTQGTTAAVILAANANRRRLIVQNTGTTIIKLALGGSSPTQTAYHVALSPCTAADDGLGGTYLDDAWTGAVRAISSGASGTLVVTELTA